MTLVSRSYALYLKLTNPAIAEPDHPYNRFVQHAHEQTQRAAREWCYEVGCRSDIGQRLRLLSAKQQAILHAYASGSRVDTQCTLSWAPDEAQATIFEQIRQAEVGFHNTRYLVAGELQRRNAQTLTH